MGKNKKPSNVSEISFKNLHPDVVSRHKDQCEDDLKQDINLLNRYARQLRFIAAAQFITLILVFVLCFYASVKLTSNQANNFPSTSPVSAETIQSNAAQMVSGQGEKLPKVLQRLDELGNSTKELMSRMGEIIVSKLTVLEEMTENVTSRVRQFQDMLKITNRNFQNKTKHITSKLQSMFSSFNELAGSENNKSSKILASLAGHEINMQRRLAQFQEEHNSTTSQYLGNHQRITQKTLQQHFEKSSLNLSALQLQMQQLKGDVLHYGNRSEFAWTKVENRLVLGLGRLAQLQKTQNTTASQFLRKQVLTQDLLREVQRSISNLTSIEEQLQDIKRHVDSYKQIFNESFADMLQERLYIQEQLVKSQNICNLSYSRTEKMQSSLEGAILQSNDNSSANLSQLLKQLHQIEDFLRNSENVSLQHLLLIQGKFRDVLQKNLNEFSQNFTKLAEQIQELGDALMESGNRNYFTLLKVENKFKLGFDQLLESQEISNLTYSIIDRRQSRIEDTLRQIFKKNSQNLTELKKHIQQLEGSLLHTGNKSESSLLQMENRIALGFKKFDSSERILNTSFSDLLRGNLNIQDRLVKNQKICNLSNSKIERMQRSFQGAILESCLSNSGEFRGLANQMQQIEDLLLINEEHANFTTAQILRSQNLTRKHLLTINQKASQTQEDLLTRLDQIWTIAKIRNQTNKPGKSCQEGLDYANDQLKVRKFVEALSQAANESYPTIRSPFYYKYDDPQGQKIGDGGHDMYDNGNYLHVQLGSSNKTPIFYNKTFGAANDIYVGYSRTSLPFVLSMLVRKNTIANFQLVLQENGNLGADGSGSYSSYSGQFHTSSITVKYEVYQVYGASDPSIIQVYFYATSSQMFGTTGSGRLSLSIGVKTTQNTKNKVTLSGDPSNAYFGYLLLSRKPPEYFAASYMEEYLLKVFGRFSVLFNQN